MAGFVSVVGGEWHPALSLSSQPSPASHTQTPLVSYLLACRRGLLRVGAVVAEGPGGHSNAADLTVR